MIHIILFILKLIGIILASILGILLFLILVVLLVPIRYRVNASNKESIFAEAKVNWLFRLLYFRITYANNHLVMKLYIFGKVFFDSDNPKEKVKREVKKVSKRVVKQVEKRVEEKVEENAEEKVEVQVEVKPEEKVQENVEVQVEVKTEEQIEIKTEKQIEVNTEEQIEVKAEEKNEEKDLDLKKQENLNELKHQKLNDISRLERKTEQFNYNNEPILEEQTNSGTENLDHDFIDLDRNETSQSNSESKKGMFHKIKSFFEKFKSLLQKIKALFLRFKDTISNIKFKFQGFTVIWHKSIAFLRDDINKVGLKHIFRSLRNILKHIRPTKLRVEMEFGSGDPCSTGQALGVFAVFYGYYGDSIKIIPNFETAILEGTLFCKGRIRLFTLLIICIKLILDKNFRQFIKNFRAFKEEL